MSNLKCSLRQLQSFSVVSLILFYVILSFSCLSNQIKDIFEQDMVIAHILLVFCFAFNHSHSKYGLETQLKSLFYLFVRLYAILCTVHGH